MGDIMYTIMKDIKYELTIKNSKFICLLYRIENKVDIQDKLTIVKESYKDATHYCYGYIIDDEKKSSDDGEPSKTAGMPILNVLENNEINNVLAVVVRYFGGIKLGASGLIRAYSKSVSNALKSGRIIKLIDGYKIIVTLNYNEIKQIDYLLKEVKIKNKVFDKQIKYEIDIPDYFKDILDNNQINYEIIKKIKIEK